MVKAQGLGPGVKGGGSGFWAGTMRIGRSVVSGDTARPKRPKQWVKTLMWKIEYFATTFEASSV